MADLNNLLPGDSVLWSFGNQSIPATVVSKGKAMVCIEFQDGQNKVKRWVGPKSLQLIYGGKKMSQRRVDAWQAALDFTRAFSVGPKRLREVFDREKAAGRINFDYGEIEARVIAYEQQFPRLKELMKGKTT